MFKFLDFGPFLWIFPPCPLLKLPSSLRRLFAVKWGDFILLFSLLESIEYKYKNALTTDIETINYVK
jgi:hypothetical protein